MASLIYIVDRYNVALGFRGFDLIGELHLGFESPARITLVGFRVVGVATCIASWPTCHYLAS